MSVTVGFGIVLALDPGPPGEKYSPATVYYRNNVIFVPKGHPEAVVGSWVHLLTTKDAITILQVMAVEFGKTQVFSPTSFEVTTEFTIANDQTVHNMYCGYATVVPEHRKYVSERRGYVLGTVRPNENWELMFQLKEPPPGCPVMNSPFPYDAKYDWMQEPVDDSAPPEQVAEDNPQNPDLGGPSNPCHTPSPVVSPDFLSDGNPNALQHSDSGDFNAVSTQHQPHVDQTAALMLPKDRSSSEDSGYSTISSLASMTISQASSSVSPSEEPAVFEDVEAKPMPKYPLIGLPYRKTESPLQLPKPEFEIPTNDDDEEYLAFEKFHRKAMLTMAEMNRRPCSDKYLRFRSSEHAIPLTLPEEKEFQAPDSDGETKTADSAETPPSEKLRFTKRHVQPEVKANYSSTSNDDWYANAWTTNCSSNGYGLLPEADSNPYGRRGSYSKKPKFVNPYDRHDSMYFRNSSSNKPASSTYFGASRNLPMPPRFTQRLPQESTTRAPAYGEPVPKRYYGEPVRADSHVKRHEIDQPGPSSAPRLRFVTVHPPPSAQQDAPSTH